MKKQQEQFLQLSDQIPYRKVSKFDIISVTYKNNAYQICLNTKYESLPPQKDYKIMRKLSDFKWLLQRLQKESPDVIALPVFVNDGNWSLIQTIETIAGKLSSDSKKLQSKQSQQYFKCRRIERLLNLLSSVSLSYIYRVPGFTQSSLFVFLDPSYQLYKLQSYQKHNLIKQPIIPTVSSPLASFVQTIGKGSMKLLSYWGGKQGNREYLQNQIKIYTDIQNNIKQVNSQIENLSKGLEVLVSNFLNEQFYLRQKQLKIYKIYVRSFGILRFVGQIITQINQITRKIQVASEKSDDRQLYYSQIQLYSKYISKQAQRISKQFDGLIHEFYRQFFENKVQIKLVNIFPSKI